VPIIQHAPNEACIAPQVDIAVHSSMPGQNLGDDDSFGADQWMAGPPLLGPSHSADLAQSAKSSITSKVITQPTSPLIMRPTSPAMIDRPAQANFKPAAGYTAPFNAAIVPIRSEESDLVTARALWALPNHEGQTSPPRGIPDEAVESFPQNIIITTRPATAADASAHTSPRACPPRVRRARGTPENSDPNSSRRPRTINRPKHNHSKVATDVFKEWFYDNLAYPFPPDDLKVEFANQTGLSYIQVR
jgi:hypothetical protein